MKILNTLTILLITTLGFTNCTKKKNNNNNLLLLLAATYVKVNTAAELAVESSANYDENNYGLVTSTKLKSWIDNWSVNKPSNISGNLVIILKIVGTSNKKYIKPATGVLVYDWTSNVFQTSSVDAYAFRQSRDNGIITDPNALPTGANTDLVLQTYGIDPTKDLIVFAASNDTGLGTDASPRGSFYFDLGRAVYWFRYWGVPKENLAILNGAYGLNGDFADSYLTSSSGELSTPTPGTFSVKRLRQTDNSVLVQPLENIISFAKDNVNHGVTGVTEVFFADARHNSTSSANEFNGIAATGVSGNALFAGHIKTARFTPWPKVIDQTTGKFKSKADLASLWSNVESFHSVNAGKTSLSSNQTIVHYCRTNARSMVAGMSAFLILGKASIFYENSFIEWSALTANNPDSTKNTLPAGSPYATDTANLTGSLKYLGTAAQYSVFNINQNATTTKKNIEEDKAYKQQ
jgi:thiosulfate/3-mercaptopyruvate sulfurtransferase